MFGFIIMAFAGKMFFDLANKNGKNAMPFAIIAVVVYLFTTFIIDFIIAFTLRDLYGDWLDYVSILFGAFMLWIVYSFLKASWSPKPKKDRRNKISNDVRSSYSTLNPSTPAQSKITPPKVSQSMSSQETGRYNKNER